MTRYELFERSRVELKELSERGHELVAADCLPLGPPKSPCAHPQFARLVERIAAARADRRPLILMMGAHPIKLGLSRFLIDLIERGWITHLATNGAGMIHDFELAFFGGTSESVARWIRTGQFGLWRETGRLNQLVAAAAAREEGIGEALGRVIEEQRPAWSALSVAAAGWRAGVPVTAHVSIGSDIVHAHPDCDGAAWGKASEIDFLIFAATVQQLEGGVFLNVGTSVTGPEVFLKALSMARNVARQHRRQIGRFTTAVFDLVELPEDWPDGPTSKNHPLYYYRPWKTILQRTVPEGGESFYFCGDHRQTVPALWHELASR